MLIYYKYITYNMEIKVKGYRCERCNWEWTSKKKEDPLPVVCPKCKSPYWNKPKGKQKH